MSMKKLKQQVATALIVAMTATNVLSAFAAETVIGKPNKKDSVTVTFDAKGGYWETASKSSASYSDAKHSVEDPVATYSQITRTFDMKGKGFDLSQYNDGSDGEIGNYFVNLKTAGEWFSELDSSGDYSALKHADGDMKFAGWYYNPENGIAEKVNSEKELYDGAKLDAGWTTQIASNVIDEIIAVGLPDDAKLVVEDLTSEKVEELEARLPEVLKSYSENLSSEFLLAEGSTPVGVDIEITGLTDAVIKENKPITLMVAAPEALKVEELGTDEHIKAIHFKDGADPIVLDVEPVKETDETGKTVYKLVFDVKPADLFSPFYFVKVKASEKEPDVEKVKVKVTGSDDGYIAAWTEDETTDEYSVIYLPVNEEVELDKGTMLYYNGIAHGNKYCESYTITNTETSSKEVVRGSHQLILENSCEIAPTFKEYDFGDDDYDDEDHIDVWLEPERVTVAGRYSGVIKLEKWDAAAKDYKAVTGAKLRIAAEEDADRWPWFGDRDNDWNLFNYVAETNEVKSKDELKLGWYELPMILTYEDEERPVYLYVDIGAGMNFIPGLYIYDGKFVTEERDLPGYDYRLFNYTNGDNWSKIEEVLKTEPINPVPRMYNYKFDGWQTMDGVKYTSNTCLVPENRNGSEFYAVAIFTDKDGKAYFGNKTSGNQGNNNNNNGSGSNFSGGGSRRHVIGGSSSTITSMTGTWTMGENGWKFLKTNGEYATNTWGYINNQWYYFNEAGDMVTGWYFVNGRWYYLNPAEGSFQGAMLTGVIFDPFYNAYFYADANGAMVTGWYQVADKWYYFNPVSDGRQGALLADTVIDGYYVGADGAWVPAS